MTINTFKTLSVKAENFSYHSFKYLEDNTAVEEVLFDTPNILLVKKASEKGVPNELLWACYTLDSLVSALKDYPHHIIKFVPENWMPPLLQRGFEVYGVLRDYWLSPLPKEVSIQNQTDFADIKDADMISELTKANRLLSREFLGEEPSFIIDWLNKDAQGFNPYNNQDAAIIIEKKQQEIVGAVFVGLYGHDHPLGPTLWIRELAVNPSCQGQGYGRKLMNQALRYGIDHGAKRSFLMADDLNIRAINLYKSLGFCPKTDEAQIDLITK